MTRKKTNPFVARHLLAKIEKVNMKEEKEIIVTWSRADRKSTRLNSSHSGQSRMPSSA